MLPQPPIQAAVLNRSPQTGGQDTLNRLPCAAQQGPDRDETDRTIRFLEGYAASHFEREDVVVRERRCPAADVNQRLHAGSHRADSEELGQLAGFAHLRLRCAIEGMRDGLRHVGFGRVRCAIRMNGGKHSVLCYGHRLRSSRRY